MDVETKKINFVLACLRREKMLIVVLLTIGILPSACSARETLWGLFFTAGLIVIGLIDWRTGYIFDICLLPVLIGGIFFALQGGTDCLIGAVVGGIVGGGIFSLVRLLSRGGIGGGDVKYAFVLGVWLGWENWLTAMYAAFLVGTAVAVYRRIRYGEGQIFFGAFMSGGAYLAFWFGEGLRNFYFRCFLL